MHDQGCGRDVSPKMGSETIFSWHSWKQVRREHENDNKEVYFVDEFLAVPDTNTLIVNIELTKMKITVVINLKWLHLYYPC